MIECAQRCNQILVEAVWTRWHPRFKRIVELVESGAIGEIKSIESQWGFKSEMTENYRLDPLLGGGELMSSFEKDVPQILKIEGSSGIIATDAGEAFSTWREPSSLRIRDRIEHFYSVDAFVEMVQHVSEQVANNSGWVMPVADSLRVAQILDAIIAS